jgi:ribosomal protein L11 methyltransferase
MDVSSRGMGGEPLLPPVYTQEAAPVQQKSSPFSVAEKKGRVTRPGATDFGATPSSQEHVMPYRRFSPFRVGQFTLVPADHPLPTDAGLPIILGRKGAFGSGEHETTAACLEILPAIPGLQGCHALDLGSGTGILALAAVRLGAARAVALDIDPQAALSCADNATLNGLSDRIPAVCGELASLGETPFDLVMANIYADILLSLAESIVSRTRLGGHILLSGIPLQEKFDVVRRYQSLGCHQLDSRIGQEYATYLFRRTSA